MSQSRKDFLATKEFVETGAEIYYVMYRKNDS